MRFILYAVYIIMSVICIILNHADWKGENIAINGAMFIIVALIFVWAVWRCFGRIDKIKKDLKNAMKQITNDYSTNNYLWESYNKNDKILFKQDDLKKAYESYKSEMRYLELQNSASSTCDIEDYINRELIDDVAKKNLLNLVPGAMTGMGILGTFVGLSIGLQNFNTGTSEEIAESIAPLMDGIKVAFHTSIYGMVFSLFFNFVYKKIFEEAYQTIDNFINIYHEKVAPDADSNNLSKIIAGQQKQTQSIVNPIIMNFQRLNDNIETMCSVQQQQLQQIQEMPQSIEIVIEKQIAKQIVPKIDGLNNSFEMFAKMVGDTQLKGMEGLIDKFTSQTNAVMTDSFQNLKAVISQTCDLQTENNEHMQTVLAKVQGMTMNIQQINELSQKTVIDMSEYVEKVEDLQNIITENCKNFGERLEKNAEFEEKVKNYIETLEEYQKQCEQSTEQWTTELKRQVEIFEEIEKKVMEDVGKEMEMLVNNSNECNKQISDAASHQIESINEAFGALDEKIAEITDNMSVCMKNMVREFGDTSQGINEQLRNEIMKTLAEFSEGFNKDILGMTEKLSGTAEQLGVTASDLGTMAKGFNGQLKKNLTDTFEVFDKELSDICMHLSGTISNIESTTGRVPKVVAAAYEGMEKNVNEIEIQMLNLINQISEVTSTVQNQIQAERNDESLSLR